MGAEVQQQDDVVALALEADGEGFAPGAGPRAVLEGGAVGEEVRELGVPDFALDGGGTRQEAVRVADDQFGEEVQEVGRQLLVALEGYPHIDINLPPAAPEAHRIGHAQQPPADVYLYLPSTSDCLFYGMRWDHNNFNEQQGEPLGSAGPAAEDKEVPEGGFRGGDEVAAQVAVAGAGQEDADGHRGHPHAGVGGAGHQGPHG